MLFALRRTLAPRIILNRMNAARSCSSSASCRPATSRVRVAKPVGGIAVGGPWTRRELNSAHRVEGISRTVRALAASPIAESNVEDVCDRDQSSSNGSGPSPSWDIRLLYDGECPLCMREVDMLRDRDAGRGKIDFVDIASPNYSPADNQGVTFEEAMGKIHGILPNGSIVQNVEVFRRCYEAIGLGWVYAVTKVEPIGKIADAVYGVWAKYRLPITGRPDIKIILEKRTGVPKGCSETDDVCELPLPKN